MAELIERGADYEDLINFQALEFIEPSADTQMARYFTRLAADIDQIRMRLDVIINPKSMPKPYFKNQKELFPSPFDEWDYEENKESRTQSALERMRERVAEAAKKIFSGTLNPKDRK